MFSEVDVTDNLPSPNDNNEAYGYLTGKDSLIRTFKEISPIGERAVIAVFMASVALEVAADIVPDKVAPVLTFGATVLRLAGFTVGGIILTSAAYYRIDAYLRRKFLG